MQLVDRKLYGMNIPALRADRRHLTAGDRSARRCAGDGFSQRRSGVIRFGNAGGMLSRLRATSASERLLALMLAALVIAASPALLSTVQSAVSLALQILLEAVHFGLIAFQIFGR